MSDSIYQELVTAFTHVAEKLPNDPLNLLVIGSDALPEFLSTDKIVFVDLTGLTYDKLVRALNHTQPLVEYMESTTKPLVLLVTNMVSGSFPMLSTVCSVDTRQHVTVIQSREDTRWQPGALISKQVYFRSILLR